MADGFELEGMAELQKRLSQLGKKAVRVENKAIKAGAEPLAESMRQEVAYSDIDHPHIRDNIVVSGISNKDGIKHVQIGPNKEVAWRAKFLVEGTVNMEPDDFMDRAAVVSKKEVNEAIKNTIKAGLKL
ncbi:HK97 gp10 family phage protein [Scopulibacillus darangshiensis]|uniref:HK97 gp10 family phage protein n=1 Tax=Scopulibacillus darangshiensis TaxID=442528 RepID=A0A4R2PCR7_9BACL|nr:HK97-gp10 family putative phage morphogenesis protein [Scopulibacillus darangshiensis]TCP32184.1 HK97 gp10 family phage protein [Scopulibacillus darangshiensis]